MTCDDAAATAERAVAVGATRLEFALHNPVLSGFGGVVHTLLPATEVPTRPPTAGRGRHTRRLTGGRNGIRSLDHVAVCVDGGTLETYADFYRDAFGFSRYSSGYVPLGGQAMDSIVVRSDSGRVTFTLVAPDPAKAPGQLNEFLDRNSGAGVQHLAFLTDDILPTVGDARDRGVQFLDTPDAYYDLLAERFDELSGQIADLRKAQVLVDRDEWGHHGRPVDRSPEQARKGPAGNGGPFRFSVPARTSRNA